MLRSSLKELSQALDEGTIRSRDLVEEALAAIEDPEGEGARTFTLVFAEEARRAADAIDAAHVRGGPRASLTGVPVSVKDLFDVRGYATTAGSIVLRDHAPALADAPVVTRLREAGAIVIGRTNMTEFAFSGIGQNPHYGIPQNPFERSVGRIPGGSSSGAAISVTDGMCAVGIGTDTGGSVRIPAAMTGLVGWKPTADRIPREAMIPLSPTLDSVGPLARSVDDAAIVDAVLSGIDRRELPYAEIATLRFLAPTNDVLEDMEPEVADAIARAMATLRNAGARIDEAPLVPLDMLDRIHRRGGFGGIESWRWHRELLSHSGHLYDPRVRVRIEAARDMTEGDLASLHEGRAVFQHAVAEAMRGYDAMLLPTIPIIAPKLTDIARDRDFSRLNSLVLRNPFIINFLDGCALSLPCHEPGMAPVGLMIAGQRHEDGRILSIGKSIERELSAGRRDPRA